MSKLELLVIHAFTIDRTGGNPAGVVLGADRLSAGEKQAIAARAGFPETAFVSRSEVATLKLDFFTPRRQIAHCGHATIAVFAHLNATGQLRDGLHSKETIDGLREVRVAGGQAAMQQLPPVVSTADPVATRRAMGLRSGDPGLVGEPVVVDTGNRFLILGLQTAQQLAALTPDLAALERLSEALDLVGAYAFTEEVEAPYAATTRMFAPRYGIREEAATGMAAGPLAGLLRLQGRGGKSLRIEQGRFMDPPSPSRLEANLELDDGGAVTAVWVSGTAALKARRLLAPEVA
jgi:PhzF family phenazine biosynthesis protein